MADNDDDSSNEFPLHKCIFEDDYRKLSHLLRTNDVASKDKHGEQIQFNCDSVIHALHLQ